MIRIVICDDDPCFAATLTDELTALAAKYEGDLDLKIGPTFTSPELVLSFMEQMDFDIIFLDPPYGSKLLGEALEQITKFDICREHGIIVAESAVETELPPVAPPYSLYREYRYGKIKLSVYHRSGNED